MERIISILLVASTTARKVVVLDDSEWDSVVISSPPVKITNSRINPKNNTSPKEQDFRYSHPRHARAVKECEPGDLKCFYDQQLGESHQRNPQETVDRFIEKFSSLTNVKVNHELKNSSSKAYWNQIDSEKHNHPYDDEKGWVSLEPIPWSTSKVSKWKPNIQQVGAPWGYGPPQNQPPSSPSWPQHSLKPQHPYYPQHNFPPETTSWALGSNGIITDHKPSDFPLDNQHSGSKPIYQSNRPDFTLQHTPIPEPYKPESSHPYPNYHPPSQSQHAGILQNTVRPPTYQWNHNKVPGFSTQSGTPSHPVSYPETGQGEWVLLSTTKGYSVPQRYLDRKMHVRQVLGTIPARPAIEASSRSLKSKYHENDIDEKYMLVSASNDGNRKSDTFPDIGEPVWSVDGIDIHKTSPLDPERGAKALVDESKLQKPETQKPEITFKRTVRLTVLPALNNSSMISHDGMLEVDANPQTVEESQKEAERIKQLQNLAVVSTGRQPHSITPILPTTQVEADRKRKAAIFAAISAGMIPATMALLLPAALGRRRRSVRREMKE